MTAQIGDKLIYLGDEYTMCSEPLEAYFARINKRPNFLLRETAVGRGYRAKWEIVDDLLFLRELIGILNGGIDVSLTTIFPKSTDWVFADWFTGTLRVPQGKLLELANRGYANRFERDMLIDVNDGVVMGSSVRKNAT